MTESLEASSQDRRQIHRHSGASIIQILHTMDGLYQLLPDPALTTASRKGAATHMIDNAPRMVGAMVRLLEGHAADLPEAQEDPDQLRELQGNAEVFKLVRAAAFKIFVLANDAYLAYQSEAVSRTRAALRRLRLSTRYLYRNDDSRRMLREALVARVETFDPRLAKGKKSKKAR